MEGFLQSLKTKNLREQTHVCALTGKAAKRYFRKRFANFRWKLTGKLYWRGKAIRRHRAEYFELLVRAYEALAQNPVFEQALIDSGDNVLCHSIGKRSPYRTILTEQEFVWLLYGTRENVFKSLDNQKSKKYTE